MKLPRRSRQKDASDRMTARFDRLDNWWLGRDRGGERAFRSFRLTEPKPKPAPRAAGSSSKSTRGRK